MHFADPLVSLAELRTGQAAVVEEVRLDGPEGERLSAIGFVAGALVSVTKCGSCSCSVRLGDGRFVLRGPQLRSIFVTPI